MFMLRDIAYAPRQRILRYAARQRDYAIEIVYYYYATA